MSAEVLRARKKRVEIEYMVWPGGAENATPVINWILENGGTARYHEEGRFTTNTSVPEFIAVDTLEGLMRATAGDVIIKGVQGEFYPCKPDIFAETYTLLQRVEVEGIVAYIGMGPRHKITLGYTADDDGIHLQCTCGHDETVGHTPDLADIGIPAANHLKEHGELA